MKRRKADHTSWKLACAVSVAICLFLGFFYSVTGAGEAAGNNKKPTKQKSEGGASRPGKQSPIFITSDWMEADRQKNILIYQGRVVAVQVDLTMRSDKLTAYFDPNLKQMKEAIAEGKVVQVTQGDRVATGTKAVFDGKAQTVTMTGNPVARQGNSEVSGERIVFFLEEDRAIVEGGKNQRVKATIFPDELQRQQKNEEEPGTEKK